MTFDDEIKALGPKPQPRPGVYSRESANWLRRYLALFPSGSFEILRRRHARP